MPDDPVLFLLVAIFHNKDDFHSVEVAATLVRGEGVIQAMLRGLHGGSFLRSGRGGDPSESKTTTTLRGDQNKPTFYGNRNRYSVLLTTGR